MWSERFIFFSFLKLGKLYLRLLPVARSAQELKVPCLVLFAVENRAVDEAYRMVVVPLGFNAVELKLLGRSTLTAASAKLKRQLEPCVPCPGVRVLWHG
jgi:hypothetical protein